MGLWGDCGVDCLLHCLSDCLLDSLLYCLLNNLLSVSGLGLQKFYRVAPVKPGATHFEVPDVVLVMVHIEGLDGLYAGFRTRILGRFRYKDVDRLLNE